VNWDEVLWSDLTVKSFREPIAAHLGRSENKHGDQDEEKESDKVGHSLRLPYDYPAIEITLRLRCDRTVISQ
jgi:hypothetical protein